MVDITKCTGIGCDKAKTCYRHNAKSGERQSMFIGLPNNKDGTCNYYIEDIKKDEDKQERKTTD